MDMPCKEQKQLMYETSRFVTMVVPAVANVNVNLYDVLVHTVPIQNKHLNVLVFVMIK